MNIRNKYSLSGLRKAYLGYLMTIYPDSKKKTVRTRVDDAFVLFKWLPHDEAWESYESVVEDESYLEKLKDLMADEFLSNRKNARKDASAHAREIKRLCSFLKIVEVLDNSRIRSPRVIKVSDLPG